jgi:sterol carrier protein 2
MAPQPKSDAFVLGVGLTPFIKPRRSREYPELGFEAGVKAMLDAQINFDDVEMGVACYCYGDTTSGQRMSCGMFVAYLSQVLIWSQVFSINLA